MHRRTVLAITFHRISRYPRTALLVVAAAVIHFAAAAARLQPDDSPSARFVE